MFQTTVLVGNLGGDPILRQTPEGVPVANFNLAVNKEWTGSDGTKKERTTWFRVTCWRGLAEVVAKYLHRGRLVLVECEIDCASPWTDADGNVHASIDVTASVVKFLDKGDRGEPQPPVATTTDF